MKLPDRIFWEALIESLVTVIALLVLVKLFGGSEPVMAIAFLAYCRALEAMKRVRAK